MTLLIHIDGAARGNPGPASLGVVIQDEAGTLLRERGRCLGERTNNAAEYEALLEALRLAFELGGTRLKIRSDSELLVRQYNGQYRVKSPKLLEFLLEAHRLARRFESVEFAHVPREQNKRADRLANQALDAEAKKAV
ncbi:MAG: ribonuclease HI family protein [Elusimicrobia bacterium]|nr:ribonuclease HI family protein [Elusimicrobiota bacterium]